MKVYKSLKEKVKGLFNNIYRNYILKQLIIWVLFFIISFSLFIYHLFSLDINEYFKSVITFIALFGLNISFVFIPVIITSSSIRKKFQKDKNQLYNLKEKLINLRYEIAYQILVGLEINDENLLNYLKKFSNPLILNPLLIDDIKTKLIKFNVPYSQDATMADLFTFAARALKPNDLYLIDKALIEVIKLLKRFGDKKSYFSFRDGYFGKDILKKLKKNYDSSLICKNFYKDVTWVIVYTLFYQKSTKHDPIHYYLIIEDHSISGI